MDKNMEGNNIISVNNSIYVAGGKIIGVLSNQVYNLYFDKFIECSFCYSKGGAFAPLFKQFLEAALQAKL